MSLQETATNAAEYSVSELSHSLKRTVEDAYGYVRLRGEVSGYRGAHASGHVYFALKDAGAKIEAVIWKGNFGKLKFKPEEGLEVIATGKITTYPGSSKYQIVIERMEPAGIGALMALLEERRKKFSAEGLFSDARKKPLPVLPLTIGIITSPTGAVIRDMLHRIADRFPLHVLVWPVRVQGDTSAEEVAQAIEGFNAPSPYFKKPDLLIVARGGGSLEDLWSFNEERVVRAAAQSAIPLISAIGHETDWTLLDHVADLRAPTPTAAVELALRVRSDLLAQLAEIGARQLRAVMNAHQRRKHLLDARRRSLPRLDMLLALPRQHLDHISSRLPRAVSALFQNKRHHLNKKTQGLSLPVLQSRLHNMSASLQALRGRSARALSVGQRRKDFTKTAQRLNLSRLREHAQALRLRLSNVSERGARSFTHELNRKNHALSAQAKLLSSLSHRSVLSRGFAVVRQDKSVVMRREVFKQSQAFTLEFFDGTVEINASEKTSGAPDFLTKKA